MRAITLFRGAAWMGVAIVGWSLNIRWGTDELVPNGPPHQWERFIVGAALLASIAALAISVSGRGERPPSWLARGIAAAAAVAVLLIGLHLRSDAIDNGFEHNLAGRGFTWMLSGGGMVLGAIIGTLGLKPAEAAASRGKESRKRRGKRR